jgi:hypothetical protein
VPVIPAPRTLRQEGNAVRKKALSPTAHPATRQAVGGFEASALLGVHFTVPYRMAGKGRLTAATFAGQAGREITFFDGEECERDWLDYCEAMAGDGTGKRPRTATADRPAAIKHLAAAKHKIALSDAIPTPEAAKIMGMYSSYAIRLAEAGTVVARQLWSPRSRRGPMQWMFSRKSCQANFAAAKAKHEAGRMQGRVRNSLKKRTLAK